MCVLGLLKGPHENLASWNSCFLVAITMEKNRHTKGSFCSERNVELLSVSCKKISNLLILQTESRWLLCKLTHYGPADLIKMNATAFHQYPHIRSYFSGFISNWQNRESSRNRAGINWGVQLPFFLDLIWTSFFDSVKKIVAFWNFNKLLFLLDFDFIPWSTCPQSNLIFQT